MYFLQNHPGEVRSLQYLNTSRKFSSHLNLSLSAQMMSSKSSRTIQLHLEEFVMACWYSSDHAQTEALGLREAWEQEYPGFSNKFSHPLSRAETQMF